MAHLRESTGEVVHRHHGENGEQGRGSGSLIDQWEAEHRAEEAEAQAKHSRSFTTTHTASIVLPGLLFRDLHLPEEAAIASAYIENNSTLATLTVYEGNGASGRVIGYVKPGSTKRMALADYISSLSIVASVADPGAAIVFVTLTSHKWSPTNGSV